MLKKAAVLAGTAASLMAMAPMAHADSSGNDGVNVLTDNNIQVLPIQACGNDVPVLGVVLPIASPELTDCSGNAPMADHPTSESNTSHQHG